MKIIVKLDFKFIQIPKGTLRGGNWVDFARDHADRLVGDGPGDAGGGLAAVAVAVQP